MSDIDAVTAVPDTAALTEKAQRFAEAHSRMGMTSTAVLITDLAAALEVERAARVAAEGDADGWRLAFQVADGDRDRLKEAIRHWMPPGAESDGRCVWRLSPCDVCDAARAALAEVTP